MTWYISSDYTPPSYGVTASAAPGSIGNGWVDVSGFTWSVDGSSVLHSVINATTPFNNSVLARTAANDLAINMQLTMTFTYNALTSPYSILRYTRSGSNNSGYIVSANQCFTLVNGATTDLGAPSSTTGTYAPVAGTDYVQTMAVNGSSPTTITGQLADTSGNVLYTATWTNSTTALQNATGGVAIYAYTNSPGTVPTSIKRLQTYKDSASASATGYSVTIASTGNTNLGTRGTVNLTGGVVLTAPLVVNLSDSLASMIAPTSVTLPTGSTGASFTLTPTVPGSHVLSYTYSGGNGGMTGNGSSTIVVTTLAFVNANGGAAVTSPWNWSPGSVAGSLNAWNAGAYIRFYVKGTTTATVYLDPASTSTFAVAVDNLNIQGPAAVPGNGQYTFTLPDTGSHYIWVYCDATSQSSARYVAPTTQYLGVQGLLLGAGGIADVASVVRNKKNVLWYGDSITEGLFANDTNLGSRKSSNVYCYSYYVSQMLFSMGYEYGIVGASGQGYTVSGDGGVVPLFTQGDDTNTSWNKIVSNVSRLDSSGKLSPQPDAIFDVHGTNDGIKGTVNLAMQNSITAFYRAIRAAAPSATYVKCIPFGGYIRSTINAAAAAYTTASGDKNFYVVDLNIDSRIPQSSVPSYSPGDGLHPGIWGGANIAGLFSAKVLQALATSASVYTPKATQTQRAITAATLANGLQASAATTGTTTTRYATTPGLIYKSQRDPRTTTTQQVPVTSGGSGTITQVVVNDVAGTSS